MSRVGDHDDTGEALKCSGYLRRVIRNLLAWVAFHLRNVPLLVAALYFNMVGLHRWATREPVSLLLYGLAAS